MVNAVIYGGRVVDLNAVKGKVNEIGYGGVFGWCGAASQDRALAKLGAGRGSISRLLHLLGASLRGVPGNRGA